ncbi:hypothetical protein K3495_g3168, partial [Podosphaera aphanis]
MATDQAQLPVSVSPYHLHMDWDSPCHSPAHEPVGLLQYDDVPQGDPFTDPSPNPPIYNALAKGINAAETRAKEARSLFGDVVDFLDNHCIPSSLPSNQALALKSFCQDLAKVASRHFEAYLRGVPPPVIDTESSTESEPSRDKRAPTTVSYANIAQRAPNGRNGRSNLLSKAPATLKLNPKSQQQRPDDRLFIRLPEGDNLRELSAYALQSHIRTKLGIDGQLLSNVQATKTGFALCPKDGDTAKLREKVSATGIFGNATIDNASPWTSYRIKHVPRTYGTINDDMKYCHNPVTTDAMHQALSEAAGVAPVAIQPSRDNELDPNSPSTSWIVRFPEEHRRLQP